MLPTEFESVCLSVQKKKRKIDFQNGSHGSYLGFSIRIILAILIYSSPQCFLPSFKTIGLLLQEKKRKIYFQDGGHGGHHGFPIGTILVIFYLQVTWMLPTKFHVNWSFSSGEKAKNRFLRWRSWRPSWIFDLNDFSYDWSTSHPDASYQVWSVKSCQLAFRFRKKCEKYILKMVAMAAILEFGSGFYLFLLYITKTRLYNFDPLKPHFYAVKLGFTGVYNIFLISAQKHRLWVLVRTALPRRF